jgi:expansin (peptidoglycan-binding protein)
MQKFVFKTLSFVSLFISLVLSIKAPGDSTAVARYTKKPAGTCSFGALPKYYAAISESDWQNAKYCGLCVKVTGPKKTITLKIVDRCSNCAAGQLGLSGAAFRKIGGVTRQQVKVSWKFTKCSDAGLVKYYWRPLSNKNFFGLQIRGNSKIINSVIVNGKPLPRDYYNYFIGRNLGLGPFSIKIIFADGSYVFDKSVRLNRVSLSGNKVKWVALVGTSTTRSSTLAYTSTTAVTTALTTAVSLTEATTGTSTTFPVVSSTVTSQISVSSQSASASSGTAFPSSNI